MATASDLLIQFPQFEEVDPATITVWLTEAARMVDSSWGDEQDRAQIFYAAHLMSMSGIGPEKGAAALAGVKTVRSGSVTIEKDDGKMGEYSLTSFGRMFYPILIGVRGGPRVTDSGEYPWPYGGSPPPFPFYAG